MSDVCDVRPGTHRFDRDETISPAMVTRDFYRFVKAIVNYEMKLIESVFRDVGRYPMTYLSACKEYFKKNCQVYRDNMKFIEKGDRSNSDPSSKEALKLCKNAVQNTWEGAASSIIVTTTNKIKRDRNTNKVISGFKDGCVTHLNFGFKATMRTYFVGTVFDYLEVRIDALRKASRVPGSEYAGMSSSVLLYYARHMPVRNGLSPKTFPINPRVCMHLEEFDRTNPNPTKYLHYIPLPTSVIRKTRGGNAAIPLGEECGESKEDACSYQRIKVKQIGFDTKDISSIVTAGFNIRMNIVSKLAAQNGTVTFYPSLGEYACL